MEAVRTPPRAKAISTRSSAAGLPPSRLWALPDDLRQREVEVLTLIALGNTNPEIAERLYLSIRTVETHRARIQREADALDARRTGRLRHRARPDRSLRPSAGAHRPPEAADAPAGMDGGRGGFGHGRGRSSLPEPSGERHPLIKLMLRRMAHGSRRGARTERATIALAIEGGGSRGVGSGGMCLGAGEGGADRRGVDLTTSARGPSTAPSPRRGTGGFGATNYINDIAMLRFANPLRLLTGHAVIEFEDE